MTSAQKTQGRAAEYRRLAQASEALAVASLLANVRERHEQAAARWIALAELDERPPHLARLQAALTEPAQTETEPAATVLP